MACFWFFSISVANVCQLFYAFFICFSSLMSLGFLIFSIFYLRLQVPLIRVQQTFVGLQDMSWRHLQHIFSITFLCSKLSWRRLVNTSWRHLARLLEDVLQGEKLLRWRRLEDMSWRRLGDKQNVYWGYLYLTMTY